MKNRNEDVVKYWEDKAEKDKINEDIPLYILIGLDIVFAVIILGAVIGSLIRMLSL